MWPHINLGCRSWPLFAGGACLGLTLLAAPRAAVAHSEAPAAAVHGAAPATATKLATPPALGKPAPLFTLKDTAGAERALADFRGAPATLYFFCGCDLCHTCARMWGNIQRSGALADPKSKETPAKTPPTLVVFDGDREELTAFADEVGLEKSQSVLLVGLDADVAQTYQSVKCPRVFVLDGAGTVRYVNDEKGAKSNEIPAALITTRAVDALRRISAPVAAAPAKFHTPENAKLPAKAAPAVKKRPLTTRKVVTATKKVKAPAR